MRLDTKPHVGVLTFNDAATWPANRTFLSVDYAIHPD
jgi:hypothetical protein